MGWYSYGATSTPNAAKYHIHSTQQMRRNITHIQPSLTSRYLITSLSQTCGTTSTRHTASCAKACCLLRSRGEIHRQKTKGQAYPQCRHEVERLRREQPDSFYQTPPRLSVETETCTVSAVCIPRGRCDSVSVPCRYHRER